MLFHGIHFEGNMVEVLEDCGKVVSRNFTHEDIQTFEEDGEVTYNSHFWFNIELYKKAVQATAEVLCALMPDNADDINQNETAYLSELDKFNEENKAALETIPRQSRILITPHDAFGHFAKGYHMMYSSSR